MKTSSRALRAVAALVLVIVACGNVMAQAAATEETAAVNSQDTTIASRLEKAIYSLNLDQSTRMQPTGGRMSRRPNTRSHAPMGADRLHTAIYGLEPDQLTRIEFLGSRHIEAPYLRYAGDSVYLAREGSEARVSAAEIEGIWVRGNSAGKGVLIGGLIGGVAMGVIGYKLNQGFNGGDLGYGAFVVGGLMGFLPGALVGAIAGSAEPAWQRKY